MYITFIVNFKRFGIFLYTLIIVNIIHHPIFYIMNTNQTKLSDAFKSSRLLSTLSNINKYTTVLCLTKGMADKMSIKYSSLEKIQFMVTSEWTNTVANQTMNLVIMYYDVMREDILLNCLYKCNTKEILLLHSNNC